MALLVPSPAKTKHFPFSPLHNSKTSHAKPISLKHQESTKHHKHGTILPNCLNHHGFNTLDRNIKRANGIIHAASLQVAKNAKDSNFGRNTKMVNQIFYAASLPVPGNAKDSNFGRNIKRVSPILCQASIPVPENAKDSNFGRILLSDVVVQRRRNVYAGRKWNSLDMATAGVVLAMHLLCVFAPFTFNWGAFWVAFGLYVITGLLGITLSFHRQLSHRSFKLPKWLEYFFAYCGVHALQGNPIDWVSTHRYHHQFCDKERDPHSPLEGFWFSHMSWLFDTNSIVERCGKPTNVGDLEKQPFYKFLQSTYVIHPIALGALLYALGGFPYIVWGMGVRIVWVYHITWLVNSACHVWGKQAWNTGDLSRNNWWVAILAFGEGWHNNHHAFEYSARHGLEWWQVDMTWYVVKFLEAVGLATDVKLPTQAQKQRLAFCN